MADNLHVLMTEPLATWYSQPAKCWMSEALPVGNGYMGAMVFGGVQKERIQFTEETVFSGGPGSHPEYNFGIKPNAWHHLQHVREFLDKGQFDQAHELANKELTGEIHPVAGNKFGDYGSQQPLADLYIEVMEQTSPATDYVRGINLREGVSQVQYTVDGIQHNREVFGSYPHRAIVSRLNNDHPQGLSYHLSFSPAHANCLIAMKDECLVLSGQLPDNKMAFESRLYISAQADSIVFENDGVTITGTRELVIYLTAATDYANQYPHYKGCSPVDVNEQTIAEIRSLTYNTIRQQAIEDYQQLFNRVNIELEGAPVSILPTDERLRRYQQKKDDKGLEALYFQFGRYLLISSSRPGTMPCNLQGKWNHFHEPAWAGDYHMNINEQMIYWPAEVTNLSETHSPLFDYIQSLVEPGQNSAREFFNAGGWIVNTMNNPFGYTSPGWQFPWGMFPAAAAWLCQHLWEHFAFSQDKQWLKQTALPLMEGAAQFWLEHLMEDSSGQLISSPSYSPEHGGISKSAFMDLEIVWDLLTNLQEAYQALGMQSEQQRIIAMSRERLAPLQVGSWEQLQEWREDKDDPDCDHRHLSHLFALHPGRQITLETTPELAAAAKITLQKRGDVGTGWSLAWKMNFWARLQDGNKAHTLLTHLLNFTRQAEETYINDGGTYPNLLCAHPPFQLDGSLGGTAGMAEMLLQSHNGIIRLLPACPDVWEKGSVSGLRARGGLEVDMKWSDSLLQRVELRAVVAGEFTIQYGEHQTRCSMATNESVVLDGALAIIS